MINKQTCGDYVKAFFGDALFQYSPIIELIVAVALLIAIISVAILFIVLPIESLLPHNITTEKVDKIANVYFKILSVLTIIALMFCTYKWLIIRNQYKEIINENIQDIQSNMYLVQNDTRGYSKAGSFVVDDDQDGAYSYTIYILKDNSYYYIKLKGVETHVVTNENIQGVKYELNLKDGEPYMTKYIGSNT